MLKLNVGALISIFITIAAMGVPQTTFAARFANQFAEFELPPQWQCNLEGAEWVCQNSNQSKKRDAIIVLAAKIKGDMDSLDQYKSYLRAPKNFTSAQGKPVKSDPKYSKERNIEGQVWIDSLHLESEIPGYYTRYLATVKQDIGVLVTYSISKEKYGQYTGDFETMVNTLKVFRKAGGINVMPQNQNLFDGAKITTTLDAGTVFPPSQQITGGTPDAPKKKPAEEDNSLFFLLVGGAVVVFIIWKRRQGRG
ncbi:MAG: hypothetical protein AABZ55_14020 [Bdellovibrionota bacterium]